MATKNHFSNYENLFSAYRESVSKENTLNKKSLESALEWRKDYFKSLEPEMKEIQQFIKNPPKKFLTVDTRKSQEFLPKLEKAEKEHNDLKSSLILLSTSERNNAENTLKVEILRQTKTKNEIIKLNEIINNPEVEAKDKTVAKSKNTRATKLLATIDSTIKKYKAIIKEDDEKLAKIKNSEINLKNIQNKFQAIQKDEKIYTRKAYKTNSSIIDEITIKKARLKEIILEKKQLPKEIEQLEKDLKTATNSTSCSIENFKRFLIKNGFSAIHAEELYELYKNPSKKLTLTKSEFKLRKQHPKRDKLIKKFVAPIAVTASAVGIASGIIAASNLIAGSKWAFITITSNPAVNFISAALPGAAIGAVAALTTIKLKDAFTKLYYNKKYGNAEKALNEPDSAKLDELIEKIENTKDEILDLRTGSNNIFSRFGRAIKRTTKNIVNRNRIHHVEAITEQLVEKFNKINSNEELGIDKKLEMLTPIHDLLSKINTFYAKDIKKSKIFAMLSCKENNANHSHKETIENLDIYAKLSMYLEKINETVNLSAKTKKKVHNQVKTDIKKQNIVAERLLNGENVTNLITKKYLELVKNSNKINTPKSKMVSNYIVVNENLKVTYLDGKTSTYQVENAENISKVESVNLGKTLLVTYKNGEQVSIPSTVAKPKINLNMAGEFTVLEKLKDSATFNYLVEKGYSEENLISLIENLKASKFNKNGKTKAKPSAFMKSKAYKENSEYAKIFEEVVAVIKNPNSINEFTF